LTRDPGTLHYRDPFLPAGRNSTLHFHFATGS
jgi:hypothetical protein